ncbi:hypothetical protein [Dongia deserti]|uniref:hypothetical protein n=1 Tax=Dongia deserti TaxID=2268030 RepID=UPI000E65061D|nr:hypothetical protein [Dongia deserti]
MTLLVSRAILIAAALSFVNAIGANVASADDWRITTAGYGPVKIGMSVDEAAQALGVKLVSDGPIDEPECHYLRPEPEVEGLWFMISNDRVVRVEVNARGITTKSGLGVGDSEAHLKEAWPTIEVTPHKYVAPDGNYLTIWARDRKSAVRFETLQGEVTSFYAGRVPEVEYVEGCS